MSSTITGTVNAWTTEYSGIGPHNIHEADVDQLSYSNASMEDMGWTRVGVAIITVELLGGEELVQNKVASLEAEIRMAEAEAQARITALKGKIQQLLAITHQPQGGAQ